MKKQMGGLISSVHKRREQFSYSIKIIKYLIKTLLSQTHVLKDSKQFPIEKAAKTKDLDNEYQVFQIIESEVHKKNKNHIEKVRMVKDGPLDLPYEEVMLGKFFRIKI
jgi:hypothetical protein